VIRASNGSLTTDHSVSLTVTAVQTAPDPPKDLVAAIVSATSVSLAWARGDGGPAPDDYDLRYSTVLGGPYTTEAFTGTGTSHTVTGLAAGDYYFQARAGTGLNNSAWVDFAPSPIAVGSTDAVNFRILTTDTDWDATTPRQDLVSGVTRAVAAGDVIELQEGTHSYRKILSLVGTLGVPVTLKGPATGQAIIRRANSASTTSGGFMLDARGWDYFLMDGTTTDPAVPLSKGRRCSIKLTHKANATASATASQRNWDTPNSGIKLRGTRDDGLGTFNVSRRGIFRRIHFDFGWDPNPNLTKCATSGIAFSGHDHNYKRATHPGQWIEGIELDDCVFENIGGEGTYIGSNPYMSVKGSGSEAGGPDCPVRYIKHYDCWFEDIGGNGTSVKSGFDGIPGGDEANANSVHDCVYVRVGVATSANGQAAHTYNGSRGSVYNCYFEECGAQAATFNCSQGTAVGFPGPDPTMKGMFFNNVVVRCSAVGNVGAIAIQKHATAGEPGIPPDSFKFQMRVFNNSIVDHQGTGDWINLSNSHDTAALGFCRNNVLPGGSINFGPYTDLNDNTTSGSAGLFFVNPDGNIEDDTIDASLVVPIGAAGTVAPAGTTPGQWTVSSHIPNFDYENATRSTNPERGAIESA
jgi:hypothetical protein